ncbi:diguanylate cyclase [Lysobacter sp. GX 14042]|uniref:diguanylate cyclase n=1 Tax=Lysobacter sp. GX 14042 TaxID=2907155 RepID=UPI001F316750|nr:diguanylate cyclase [Lysobacter sp. GX 14042]
MTPDTSPGSATAAAVDPLAARWRELLAAAGTDVAGLLDRVCGAALPEMADHFYGGMLADPRASRYLSVEKVRDRLKPSMQRWLREVLSAAPGDVDALVATQKVVGDVHARIGVPVDLVSRGARELKGRLYHHIERLATDPEQALRATTCVSHSVDLALEFMTQAYVSARERSSAIDASYRLFSLVQNISTERERQRALLLDWENALLYAVAGRAVPAIAECGIRRSEFGLWFTHKGLPSFGETAETREITSLMAEVDAELTARLPDVDDPQRRQDMLRQVRAIVGRIRAVMGLLFENIGDLEAGRDALTSLLNRRFLPTVLRREIEHKRRSGDDFALLLLDLDHFKPINDRYGHEAGDRALHHLATVLTQSTRGSDYLFRYGGEEFVVVLGSVNQQQALAIAENLRQRIAASPAALPDGNSLPLTASIGVAMHDGHPDYERMLARADAAMYHAKRTGRDRVVLAEDSLPEPPGAQSPPPH